jgi:putative transposase
VVTPAARRSIVIHLKDGFQFSERQACVIVGLCRSSCRYQAKPNNDAEIRSRLRELAEQRRKFGSPRLHTLLKREGRVINHKRTERLYKEEGLSLRLKKRKKRISHLRVVMDRPERINQHWSMDFVSDSLYSGRRFRVLTIVDDLSKECPVLEVDHSLTGTRVARVLDRIAMTKGLPEVITVDNGPEFISKALDLWAFENNVKLRFIQPGKPTQNAYIESFNGKFRDECLNDNVFVNLHSAQKIIETWRQDYNLERPHSSLNGMAPTEFARTFEKEQKTEKPKLKLVLLKV